MRNGRSQNWLALLCFLLIFSSYGTAFGDETGRPDLPIHVRRVLKWLPEDTETVVASQSFRWPTAAQCRTFRTQLQFFGRLLPLSDVANLESGKYLQPLAGRKVSLALRGSRNYETVSKFGTQRNEGCLIAIFETDLDSAADEWVGALRAGATKVEKIAGREIFVFPSTTWMPGHDIERWQGTFLALLPPETVLCASSYTYLEELLSRADGNAAKRALPDDLPEWKYVDTAASAWMLRRVPEACSGRLIDGVVWSLTNAKIEITYVPLPARSDNVEGQVRGAWNAGWLETKFNVKLKAEIHRSQDGTVSVSASTGQLDSHGHSTFRFSLHQLQAENGSVGNQ